jgi:uncharacterized membrane protein
VRLRRPTLRWPSLPTLYLLVALPAGLAFSLLIPPSQVLDESAHFFRVWQIAEGNVVAERTDLGDGQVVNSGTYDLCVREYVSEFGELATTPQAFELDDYWFDTPDCSPQRRDTFVGEAMGSYSIWTYPGQSVGVIVGRSIGLPLPVTFFLGRILGLLTAVGMAWHAIRVAPRARLVITLAALLPMSLMGAAGYSPDGLVLGTSLIVIAYALKFALTDALVRRRDVVVLAAAMTALTLSKPPYVVLALLFLTVRPGAAGTRRRTATVFGSIAGGALFIAAIWNRIGFPQGAVEAYRPGIDRGGQMKWILGHPLDYLNVLWDTVFYWETQEFVVKGWVGAFGMFRSGVGDSPLMVPVFVLVAAVAIGAFTFVEAGPARTTPSGLVARVRPWVPLVALVGTVLGIYTSAYIAWDAVGAPRIYGIQGRYFIPLLPLPAAVLALRRHRSDSALGERAVAVVALVLLTAAFVKIGTYFY